MDRINGLNANQLSKELRQYEPYKHKTLKEIKEQVGNTANLRETLRNLLKTSSIEEKIYHIGGESYTEDELMKMIAFYKNNHIDTKINKLPDDVLQLILYESDINTIIQYCSTGKYNTLCNNAHFWKSIFKRDHIKLLSNPTTTNDWIAMYKNVLGAQKEAFALQSLEHEVTGGVYDFKINEKFNLYFEKYADFLPKVNTFYTNGRRNGMNLRSDMGDKLISSDEFYNLLVDLLYFYPDIYISSPAGGDKEIPLRKKDIGKLRSTRGFKTVANKILYHHQKKELQFKL